MTDGHIVVSCPRCSQKLRLPVLPKAIRVTCKACGHMFVRPASHIGGDGDQLKLGSLPSISTPIQRSGKSMAEGAFFTVLFTVIGILCLSNEHEVWGGICTLIALSCFFGTITGSFKAKCPSCGKIMAGITKSGMSRCACLEYAEGREGRMYPLEESYTSSSPCFALRLSETGKFLMPMVCCVCGAPSSHDGKAVLLSTGGSTNAFGITTVYQFSRSLGVPYCQEHTTGATLDYAERSNDVELKIQSYRFYRNFIHLNQVSLHAPATPFANGR